MPFHFSRWHKWIWVWLLSAITLLTPFATSILSPAINTLDADFHNDNATVGSMTVSIYLFGYVVGPVFIGPLSEVYGRKLVLSAANVFFCLWQIGCALAPNVETLIVSRFFSGVGGAACLVGVTPSPRGVRSKSATRLNSALLDTRGQHYRRPVPS
jgi:MFS family permease